MQDQPITQERLARLLREAERAHAEYERQLGHPDADWPDWYATYIVSKLQESRSDEEEPRQ